MTYDNGGSRDFAYDGKTALVAPHKDRAVLTQKLALLVADPVLRGRIAQHGREYVEHMSTWRMQAQLLADTLTHTV